MADEGAQPLDLPDGWEMVLDVQGGVGTMDYAEEAFNAKLKKLACDARVRGVKAKVLTDGVEENPLFGARSIVIGYQIAVKFETAAAGAANAA